MKKFPKVKLHEKNGTVTISGLDHRYARDIMIAASLHCYDNPFKSKPFDAEYMTLEEHEASEAASKEWHRIRHLLADAIDKLIVATYAGTYHHSKPTPKQLITERWKTVRADKTFRQKMNEMWDEICAANLAKSQEERKN